MKREKQLSSSRNESSRDSRISLGIENLVPPAKKLTEEIPSERCCQSWCEANRRTGRLHEGEWKCTTRNARRRGKAKFVATSSSSSTRAHIHVPHRRTDAKLKRQVELADG